MQPGTNSSGTNQVTVLMTWNDTVLKQLDALQNAPTLNAALALAASGDSEGVIAVTDTMRQSWNLSRPDGSCAVPVIVEGRYPTPIYRAGQNSAEKIADHSQPRRPRPDRQEGHSGTGSVLIAAHDLIWEVLDKLVRDRVVSAPAVLRDTAATPQSLEALLTIVVNKH